MHPLRQVHDPDGGVHCKGHSETCEFVQTSDNGTQPKRHGSDLPFNQSGTMEWNGSNGKTLQDQMGQETSHDFARPTMWKLARTREAKYHQRIKKATTSGSRRLCQAAISKLHRAKRKLRPRYKGQSQSAWKIGSAHKQRLRQRCRGYIAAKSCGATGQRSGSCNDVI